MIDATPLKIQDKTAQGLLVTRFDTTLAQNYQEPIKVVSL